MTTTAHNSQGSGDPVGAGKSPAVAMSPAVEAEKVAPVTDETSRTSTDAALGERVDEMLSAARGGAAAAPLASLDEELAALADELVSGDVTDGAEMLAAAPGVATARAETGSVAEELEREVAPPPGAPAARRVVEEARDPEPPEVAGAGLEAPAVRGRPAIITAAAAAPKRIAKAVSLPLAGRSQLTRQLVGYVALTQLFFAACLWSYVLLVRGGEPAGAQGATLLASGEVEGHGGDAAHGGGAGRGAGAYGAGKGAGAGHGDPNSPGGGVKAKPDSHAGAKPDAHGASKGDAHGGASDGHGAPPKAAAKGSDGRPKPGARSTETLGAKRPGVKSSKVMPARPASKTASKAADGHGAEKSAGGH